MPHALVVVCLYYFIIFCYSTFFIQEYQALAGELVANENLMLQTLGFDIGIDHPHTHVVKCCQLVKASKVLIVCHIFYFCSFKKYFV